MNLLSLCFKTVALHVLTMKKMTDFYTNVLKASNALKNLMKKRNAVFKDPD